MSRFIKTRFDKEKDKDVKINKKKLDKRDGRKKTNKRKSGR